MRRPSHAAVIAYVALFMALGGTATAATGGTLILGHSNTAGQITKLTNTNGSAMSFNAPAKKAPFTVNRIHRVANLNADMVDGKHARAFVAKCGRGSVAAAATWYVPGLPADPTYVTPTRYGGENGFMCGGGSLQLTKEATGFYRMTVASGDLPRGQQTVLFVNPDSRESTPLYGYGTSRIAGPTWDIRVFDKTGAPADPYYIDVALISFP
jgi:hypothetical protein